ncbi:MAG TPA: AzlD domain-containing protein, partial [Rhodoglobus sp.]|nr:AzlD domain-containing protein [Rhodoglobus sp.]
MTVWQIIILASIAVLAIKLVGYLIPPSLVERPTPARIANLLTVALLAALITVQTLGVGQGIQIDA